MAGGILDPLYETFMARTNDALNQPDQPWQQELMESVNPEKVKRQNVMRALAQASQTLATTPGNFLAGLSAAAGTGANSYLNAQEGAEQDRMRAMQLVQAAQQKSEDRRLALLSDALGVGRNLKSDQRADRQEARAKMLDDARAEYDRSGGRRTGGGASGADAATERRRGTAATTYFRQLDKMREDNLGEEPSEEEKDQLWGEIQRRFKIQDDVPPDEGEVPVSDGKSDQQVTKTDTASIAPGGAIVANTPPPLEQRIVGKVYATQKGNFMWTGQGWKPVL